MRHLADPCYFGMVVKNFSRKKVDFPGKQHAHHQGMGPILISMFSSVSQSNRRALSAFDLKLRSTSFSIQTTKQAVTAKFQKRTLA